MKRLYICLAAAIIGVTAHGADRDSTLTSRNTVRLTDTDLERSFGLDLRERLTGRIPGLDVIGHGGQQLYSTTNFGSPWFASSGNTFASKGWSSLTCFVDGIPVPFQEFLFDPNQIESVEFITDVSDKGSLNPLASSGAIYITTKQGGYNTPMRISTSVESGIAFVDNIPEWVDGVTYARLNNLARANAGYPTLYDEDMIAGYAQNDPYSLSTPNVDYKSLMLRSWKPTTRFGINAYGGSSNIKYNLSINGINDGDIYKVGPTTDYNKINLSSSVTAKIGRWIEARASFHGLIGVRRGNRSGGLYDYASVPAIAFPVALGRSLGQTDLDADKAGTMIYAVSRDFQMNPYARTVEAGYFVARSRSGMFNADVDIDLGWMLEGLKTKSIVNFSSYYYLNAGKTNDYIAYYWDASQGIVDLSTHVGTKAASKSTLGSSSYQSLNFQQDLTYSKRWGQHSLDARASYYISDVGRAGNTNYERLQMGVARADWKYSDRFAADISVQYAGAMAYAPKARYALFPTAGFTWNASKNLRFNAQAGRVGYANIFYTNYLYQALYNHSNSIIFGPATAYQWFGSDKQTVKTTSISRLANPNLTWPKIDEFDLSGELALPNGFGIALKGYYINRTGIFSDTISEYVGAYGISGITYYENYDERRTLGGELTLSYRKAFGDFRVDASLSATSWRTKVTKTTDDFWLYDWQKLTGRDESDITGYVCIGRFENQDQIDNLPKLDESDTHLGDLMYEDLNGDGLIDTNDRKVIGNSNPKLRYALNIDLQWKNFSLLLVGTGHAFYDQALTNAYFWNGWGNGNYTKFVSDNIGGDYPRLSYDKSSSNFVVSDFWLRKGGWFKLKSAELAYTLHPSIKGVETLRFTLTGSNLFTISGLEYVDPEDVNAGVSLYPFFRSFLAGVKITF